MENGNDNGSGRDSRAARKPALVSNHFDEYFQRRGDAASEQTLADGEEYSHLTGPLRPSRPLPHKERPRPTQPSVFSDLERSSTVDRFASIFMERMGEAMSSGKLSRAWQGSDGGKGSMFSWLTADYSPEADAAKRKIQSIDPDDYAAERNMMKPHLTPAVWGSSCMVVTLFSIRLGRWYQGRNAVRTMAGSVHRTNPSSAQRMNGNVQSLQDARRANLQQRPDTPFHPRNAMKEELQSGLLTLPVDMALSMLVGISTTLFLTRPHYLMNDVAHAPLLEGRSALAEELCVPFREEMEEVNRMFYTYTPRNSNASTNGGDGGVEQRQVISYAELWKDENAGDFDSIRAIRDFVSNCRERERVARQRFEADGIVDASEEELMEARVPPPGISRGMDGGD